MCRCCFRRGVSSSAEHRVQKVCGDDGKCILFIRMTWPVSIRASCWRCWMKRTRNRSLGLLPSGKVTLFLLTLEESCGIFRGPQKSFILSSHPIDFRRRFLSLLSYQFSTFSPSLALNILQNKNIKQQPQPREYQAQTIQLNCSSKTICVFIRILKYMWDASCEVPGIALGQLQCFVPTVQKNACLSKLKLRTFSATENR